MEGTVKPAPNFDAEKDCEVLRKAMKGLGTDEKAIIGVVANRSNQQRQQIRSIFKTMYGKDLTRDLKSELGGKLEDVIVALFQKPDEYDATECHEALSGVGTDEGPLIEILCSRNNKEIGELKAAYKKLFSNELEDDLSGDLSGHFRRLMFSLCNASRQEYAPIDEEKAKQHAKELYEAGVKCIGTDESTFNKILCSQSFPQLKLTFEEYEKKTGKTLQQAVSSEMSGDIELGLKAIVKCVQNKQAYFAGKLHKSMKGAGTDDHTLMRIIVSRCEVDLVQIKEQYVKHFDKNLADAISSETSGDYKKMLLALVK